MDSSVIRFDSNMHCMMEHLDFSFRTILAGEAIVGDTANDEVSITVLSGVCKITAEGQTITAGKRMGIFEGGSPHVTYIPAQHTYRVLAETQIVVTIARTPQSGELSRVMHVQADSISGFSRGNDKTLRTVYELTPEAVPTKLMVFEVFTPAGNWSSFPPHKHDVESDEESLLQEVYLFSFDPPEGFALIWLSDDDLTLDNAYAVRNGDLITIPRGYHTMCVSPGFTCSTHCIMAGLSDSWKIKIKPQYQGLLDWER
jgi:5-deoxy-glucuronate isomerase